MRIQEVNATDYNNIDYFRDVKRVLEIGVGGQRSAVTPALDPDLYVVTDVKNPKVRNAADLSDNSLILWHEPDPRVLRIYADGTNLPFPDGEFDAVFAANVIGDPGIAAWTKVDIITEALRVTKKVTSPLGASALWLVEDATPEYALEFMEELVESSHGQTFSVMRASVKNWSADVVNEPICMTIGDIYRITTAT